MSLDDFGSILVVAIPVLSLAGIATSASARTRPIRWVAGVLGWVGWMLSVAVAAALGMLFVGLACSHRSGALCGDRGLGLVALVALVMAVLPGLFAYGLGRSNRSSRNLGRVAVALSSEHQQSTEQT